MRPYRPYGDADSDDRLGGDADGDDRLKPTLQSRMRSGVHALQVREGEE